MPQGHPHVGPPTSINHPLSQADLERIEQNRLAALERRRLAASRPSSSSQQQQPTPQPYHPSPGSYPANTAPPRFYPNHQHQFPVGAGYGSYPQAPPAPNGGGTPTTGYRSQPGPDSGQLCAPPTDNGGPSNINNNYKTPRPSHPSSHQYSGGEPTGGEWAGSHMPRSAPATINNTGYSGPFQASRRPHHQPVVVHHPPTSVGGVVPPRGFDFAPPSSTMPTAPAIAPQPEGAPHRRHGHGINTINGSHQGGGLQGNSSGGYKASRPPPLSGGYTHTHTHTHHHQQPSGQQFRYDLGTPAPGPSRPPLAPTVTNLSNSFYTVVSGVGVSGEPSLYENNNRNKTPRLQQQQQQQHSPGMYISNNNSSHGNWGYHKQAAPWGLPQDDTQHQHQHHQHQQNQQQGTQVVSQSFYSSPPTANATVTKPPNPQYQPQRHDFTQHQVLGPTATAVLAAAPAALRGDSTPRTTRGGRAGGGRGNGRGRGRAAGRSQRRNKGYGSATSFTFTPSAAAAGRGGRSSRGKQAKRKLTQSTLGETMSKWRAKKGNNPDEGQDDGDDQFDGGPEDLELLEMVDGQGFEQNELMVDNGLRFYLNDDDDAVAQQAQRGMGYAPMERVVEEEEEEGLFSSASPFMTAPHHPPPFFPQPQQQQYNQQYSHHQQRALRSRAQHVLCGPDSHLNNCNDDDCHGSKGGAGAGRWEWLKERRDAAKKAPDDPGFDPSTLFLPPKEFEQLKGFNRQYWSIKRDCMDLVLFVRVGAFYELYDIDADIGLRAGLNPMGATQAANMWKVGCTASAFSLWAGKVLALGYSIGRVEESGPKDPYTKLVPRQLTQIYTLGTVLDATMQQHTLGDGCGSGFQQPFVALFEGCNAFFGACIIDVPGAVLSVVQWQESDAMRSMLSTLLVQVNPAEVVVMGPGALTQDTVKVLKRYKPLLTDGIERSLTVSQLRRFALRHNPDASSHLRPLLIQTEEEFKICGGKDEAVVALGDDLCAMPHAAAALLMAIHHLKATGTVRHVLPCVSIQPLAIFSNTGAQARGHMLLDSTAIRTLELLESSLGGKQGSLLEFLEGGVKTPGGRRKLRAWLCAPLYRVGDIQERLDFVSALMLAPEAAGSFQALLSLCPDTERLLPKVATILSSVVESSAEGGKDDGEGADDDWDDAQHAHQGHYHYGDDSASRLSTRVSGDGAGLLVEDEMLQLQVADVKQGRFTPIVQLLQGLDRLLQAVMELNDNLSSTSQDTSFPPLVRALAAWRAVLPVLTHLQHLFNSDNFSSPGEDLVLDPGINPDYDAAMSQVQGAEEDLQAVLNTLISSLAAVGAPQTALKKLKLLPQGPDTLVQVPQTLKPFMIQIVTRHHEERENGMEMQHQVWCGGEQGRNEEDIEGIVLVKETKTVARFQVRDVTRAVMEVERKKMGTKAVILNHLTQAAEVFLEAYPLFLNFSSCISTLDVLAGFAEVTHPQAAPAGCSFCRPVFNATAHGHNTTANISLTAAAAKPVLKLHGLWSPQLLLSNGTLRYKRDGSLFDPRNGQYITTAAGAARTHRFASIQCNDLVLGGKDSEEESNSTTLLLTGVNTGGKSTLLRSTCIAAILAQLGCYVPCTAAELTPVDRIFTRIGAHDRLAAGESTFCVEMTETAAILLHAQPSSLVVLDELGRGTSTFDGYAIAHAVTKWLHQNTGCRVLHATHYHGLTRESDLVQPSYSTDGTVGIGGDLRSHIGVQLGHMVSRVDPIQGLMPLFQLAPGPAPEGSCGVEVAGTAGLPRGVLERAQEMGEVLQRRNMIKFQARRDEAAEGHALPAIQQHDTTSNEEESEGVGLERMNELARRTVQAVRQRDFAAVQELQLAAHMEL